jgi:hypothetical protein
LGPAGRRLLPAVLRELRRSLCHCSCSGRQMLINGGVLLISRVGYKY